MRRRTRGCQPWLLVCALVFAGVSACTPPCLNAWIVADPAPYPRHLRAGDYEVVLRAVSGPRKGEHTSGILTLRRASRHDRSPRTGKGPCERLRIERRVRFVGWFNVQLGEIGVTTGANPGARDLIYPGVLVRQDSTYFRIGSTDNRRDHVQGKKFTGLILKATRLRPTRLSGIFWAGEVQGVFCAKRLRVHRAAPPKGALPPASDPSCLRK